MDEQVAHPPVAAGRHGEGEVLRAAGEDALAFAADRGDELGVGRCRHASTPAVKSNSSGAVFGVTHRIQPLPNTPCSSFARSISCAYAVSNAARSPALMALSTGMPCCPRKPLISSAYFGRLVAHSRSCLTTPR